MSAHSAKPFIAFHLAVGTRLALLKLAPILAVAFAAYYLLGPELFNIIFAALLEKGSLLMGLVSSVLALSVAAMAAPRICLGLNGWIRHLPARGLTHRRLAGTAIAVAQAPLLLVLALLSLIAFVTFQVPPFLYLLGLPVLGLAAGLYTLPLCRSLFAKPLAFGACVLSTSGHWAFLVSAGILLIVADRTAHSLSPSRKSRVTQSTLSGPFFNTIVSLRALRFRILFPYLSALSFLGLTFLFLSNNTLTPHQTFRGVIFGGTLSIAVFCAFVANALAIRRPSWPWARSLPWSAYHRILTDTVLIGLLTVPLLVIISLLKIQAIWPVAASILPLASFNALMIRTACMGPMGILGRTSLFGAVAAVLISLIPAASFVFLASTPILLIYSAAEDKKQKVSVWLEMHHLAAGDSLSWSRQ